MRFHFVYSAALATVVTVIAVDMSVQHLASAQEVNPEAPTLLAKATAATSPVVFARYAKNDPSMPKQGVQETMHCISDAFQAATDVCGIMPLLTSVKGQNTSPQKWRLAKTPLKFLWQQEVLEGRKLVVELSDDSGPTKGKIETFRNGNKLSVLVTPEPENQSDEFFLSAHMLDKDGKKLEAWLLPIVIGEPE